MITVKAHGRTDLGGSSGARDDAGGSSGSPRDTKTLPGNLFGSHEPATEHSRTKKKKNRIGKKRIYQLGITVPAVNHEDATPSRSA